MHCFNQDPPQGRQHESSAPGMKPAAKEPTRAPLQSPDPSSKAAAFASTPRRVLAAVAWSCWTPSAPNHPGPSVDALSLRPQANENHLVLSWSSADRFPHGDTAIVQHNSANHCQPRAAERAVPPIGQGSHAHPWRPLRLKGWTQHSPRWEFKAEDSATRAAFWAVKSPRVAETFSPGDETTAAGPSARTDAGVRLGDGSCSGRDGLRQTGVDWCWFLQSRDAGRHLQPHQSAWSRSLGQRPAGRQPVRRQIAGCQSHRHQPPRRHPRFGCIGWHQPH